jgi:GntR family transcriptional regulator
MALFSVDPASNVPVYEQIVDKLRYAIAAGVYAPGDPLPSVRQLAIDLLVNPNTVAKAYHELERAGLTRSRKGLGVYVAESAPRACREVRRRIVAQRIAAALGEAARSGLDPDEIEALVQEELDKALDHARQAAANRE